MTAEWVMAERSDVAYRWRSNCELELQMLREDGLVATTTVSWSTAERAQEKWRQAVDLFTEKNVANAVKVDGQGQCAHRTWFGYLTHLYGPPTWWVPQLRVNVRKRRAMVGWLRRGVVVTLGHHK